MTVPSWLTDTIARRFVVTEVLAVAVTLAMVGLFSRFGGVWSQEPLDGTGLLNEATDILRVIEAAPPQLRPELTVTAATPRFRANWYAATSAVATSLDAKVGAVEPKGELKAFAAEVHRAAVALEPGQLGSEPIFTSQQQQRDNARYALAVQLNDQSWLVFTVASRVWGPPRSVRWGIWLSFLAASITVVTVIAARQFSGPIEQLATAVRQFGINPRAPPIPETGPRELRQVVRTFNGMQAQIQKFVAYRTMMLAAISHDLRTPLTRMRLRGEFIEDREQQERLFRDVDEMQTMVDGALAFFRDDAVAEATTTFDLPHVLLTIANDYADQKIDISYTGPAHAVYRGRPFALKRAFANLVENAVKYGTLPQIELSCDDTGYVVAVRDCGPGIPQEALESVFRPYYRLDKSRNRNTGGVGLGLTVVQAIVHGHGGEIVLSNRCGGGLEARVTLPVAAQEKQQQ
jgi:signal transduction histidine kinase